MEGRDQMASGTSTSQKKGELMNGGNPLSSTDLGQRAILTLEDLLLIESSIKKESFLSKERNLRDLRTTESNPPPSFTTRRGNPWLKRGKLSLRRDLELSSTQQIQDPTTETSLLIQSRLKSLKKDYPSNNRQGKDRLPEEADIHQMRDQEQATMKVVPGKTLMELDQVDPTVTAERNSSTLSRLLSQPGTATEGLPSATERKMTAGLPTTKEDLSSSRGTSTITMTRDYLQGRATSMMRDLSCQPANKEMTSSKGQPSSIQEGVTI